MNKFILSVAILCVMISVVSAQLKPTSFSQDELVVLDPKNAISLISEEQDELYKKVVRDYLKSFVRENMRSEEIIRVIYMKFTAEDAWTNVRNFMIETLFKKFEMHTLSESFGSEIRQFPDNYFLTFEMYDLLHD